MRLQIKLDWIDPLELAAGIPDNEKKWVLLYSGVEYDFTGHYSILALRCKEEITASDFNALSIALSSDKQKLENSWFGYLGYDLKNALEDLPLDQKSYIDFPDLWFLKFGLILLFDHKEKKIEVWCGSKEELKYIPIAVKIQNPKIRISHLKSNMTKGEYLAKVSYIKDAIDNGDLYQANLTRKFYGAMNLEQGRHFDIFAKLCTISPSSYSAFFKFGDKYVLSSSPERFVYIDHNGNVETRPIKGTAARHKDKKADEEAREALAASIKDKAENLMIVDLSRNDLSRTCEVGSVEVSNLFGITSYATVHHMSSVISAKKDKNNSSLDVIKGCFPPGSMTGTPKIKAMQLCSNLEKLSRGVYSGAVGWFGGDGSVDLSVVIRTIVIDKKKFEFQVGGAIIADSDSNLEFEETISKARGISESMGIDVEALRAL